MVVVIWTLKVVIRRDRKLAGVLEDVRHRFLAVDVFFENAVLVDAYGAENIEDLFVDIIETVKHQTDNDLLPGGSSHTPELRLFQVYYVSDVLHHAM